MGAYRRCGIHSSAAPLPWSAVDLGWATRHPSGVAKKERERERVQCRNRAQRAGVPDARGKQPLKQSHKPTSDVGRPPPASTPKVMRWVEALDQMPLRSGTLPVNSDAREELQMGAAT